MSLDVEDTEQHSCDLDVKIKGQIMYILVNASPPKLLDVVWFPPYGLLF